MGATEHTVATRAATLQSIYVTRAALYQVFADGVMDAELAEVFRTEWAGVIGPMPPMLHIAPGDPFAALCSWTDNGALRSPPPGRRMPVMAHEIAQHLVNWCANALRAR